MKGFLDIAAGLISVLSGMLPMFEGRFHLLSVNPVVRAETQTGSALATAIIGLLSYMLVRYHFKRPWIGIGGVLIFLVALLIVFILPTVGAHPGMDGRLEAILIRIFYPLVFIGAGIALGGALGLYPRR